MKIRMGFVTNSSSTLFILGFKKEDGNIAECILKQTPLELAGIIINDVMSNLVSPEKAVRKYREEVNDMYYWDVDDKKKRQKLINDKVNEFRKKIEGMDRIAFVQYGNDGGDESGRGAEIECFVLPYTDFCIASINYH